MKYFSLLLLLLFAFSFKAYPCDPITFSFCTSSIELEDEKIFLGIITDQDSDGTELEILEIIQGVETENTITVWDGTDIYCNGPFSMATSFYGDVGDTVICMVEEIVSIQNSWDVVGDYRRPSSLNYTTYLTVNNDSLWDWEFSQMISYTQFVNGWSNNCVTIQSNAFIENYNLNFYPNPTSEYLFIENEKADWLECSILSLDGRLISPQILNTNSNQVDVKHLDSGAYFLKLIEDSGKVTMTRFIKM